MFWKKRIPKYNLIDDPENPQDLIVCVGSGPFKGIKYKYLVVTPKIENDHLRLSFSYELCGSSDIEIEDEPKFIEVMGNILVDIMEKNDNTKVDT